MKRKILHLSGLGLALFSFAAMGCSKGGCGPEKEDDELECGPGTERHGKECLPKG